VYSARPAQGAIHFAPVLRGCDPTIVRDLVGLDIVLDIMETLYNHFDDSKYRPSPLLKQMCDDGYVGRKTGKGFFSYDAAA